MSGREPLPLAIVISGRGSNMLAIAHACRTGAIPARIARVIADRATADGLTAAAHLGLPTALITSAPGADRSRFEAALSQEIDASGAEVIALAGFMKILSAPFVARYTGRLLNIHPSLLPLFKGLHTHRRALSENAGQHGASVHFVTAELDGGPVILQASLQVAHDETEQSLAARVQRLEHRIYPQVIGWMATGRLAWRDGAPWLDGAPLARPVQQQESAE
jgi:phosphoribosylglycinamide formyltransferase-1